MSRCPTEKYLLRGSVHDFIKSCPSIFIRFIICFPKPSLHRQLPGIILSLPPILFNRPSRSLCHQRPLSERIDFESPFSSPIQPINRSVSIKHTTYRLVCVKDVMGTDWNSTLNHNIPRNFLKYHASQLKTQERGQFSEF